jgi:four helix bundle protein
VVSGQLLKFEDAEMTKLKSYRDLVVWQKGMDLVEAVYRSTREFPKEEIYGLTSQLRRAAVSIPSNISEGQSRNSPGEFLHHLGIARGSLSEAETQVMISRRLGYLTSESEQTLLELTSEIGRLLNGLLRSLTTDH